MIKLKEIREQKGMTQERLSELSGVSQSTISQYETGAKSWTYRTVEPLARALEVQVWDLITKEEGRGMTLEELLELVEQKASEIAREGTSESKRIKATIDLLRIEMEAIGKK